MVSLEVALPAAEVCLERAAVVQVHWSCDVSWYFFNKGVWATGFSRNVWNMGGCFLHCVIAVWKMPHTTGKPWVRQLVWWQQCFIREHWGSYEQQLWRSSGAAWMWTFHANQSYQYCTQEAITWHVPWTSQLKLRMWKVAASSDLQHQQLQQLVEQLMWNRQCFKPPNIDRLLPARISGIQRAYGQDLPTAQSEQSDALLKDMEMWN